MIQSNSSFNIMWVSGGRIFRFFPWTFLVIVTTTAQPVMLHIVRTTVYVWALYRRPIQPNCLVEAVLVFRYLLTVSAILLLINVVFNSHFCVGYFKVSCQVTHTMPKLPCSVTGITLLNDRLYFCHCCKPNIAVCCPATFQFQEYINCACPSCGKQSGIFQCRCYNHQSYSTTLKHLVACNFNNVSTFLFITRVTRIASSKLQLTRTRQLIGLLVTVQIIYRVSQSPVHIISLLLWTITRWRNTRQRASRSVKSVYSLQASPPQYTLSSCRMTSSASPTTVQNTTFQSLLPTVSWSRATAVTQETWTIHGELQLMNEEEYSWPIRT